MILFLYPFHTVSNKSCNRSTCFPCFIQRSTLFQLMISITPSLLNLFCRMSHLARCLARNLLRTRPLQVLSQLISLFLQLPSFHSNNSPHYCLSLFLQLPTSSYLSLYLLLYISNIFVLSPFLFAPLGQNLSNSMTPRHDH